MTIYVQTLDNYIVATIDNVKSSDTIGDVKSKLDGSLQNLKLYYDKKQLEDERPLSDYGIVRDGITTLVMAVQVKLVSVSRSVVVAELMQ